MTTISARRTLSRFIESCAFLALIAAGSAQAATIPVTSFLDNGVNCTLRKAILNANAGGVVPLGSGTACAAGSPTGGNVIVLGTGTYLFDLAPANGLPAGSFDQFDLVNNNITIQGNGPANTIIDGQEKDFIFDNFNGTTNISITLTGFTVTRGKKGPSGFDFGGMYMEDASVTLDNVAFTNNTTTASGAAVYNGNGTLTINNSTFSGNVSSGEGGAIRSTGPLVITNSTFTGNSAVRGGALYFAGNDPVGTETAAISNSTFSGNTATQMGGAISLSGSTGALGAMTLTHVTIANNTVTLAGGTGGGIYKNQSGGFNIDRSIIANNTAPTGPNCNASAGQFFNSLNYNVIGSANNCTINGTTTNNFVGAVPLNALAGNGGPTQTISLPAYSPARDRAPTCATPTDQRGSARPLGIQCDSGAFEASPTVPQAPPIGTATAGNGQASITFTASANNGGAPITGYTMTSSPSGIIGTGATSPIVVSGLTNGTAYTFTVTATNSVGTSAASAASNSVTPSGPPGAPTIGTATAGNAQASVTFTAPASNGGSPITSYTATSSPGGLTASGAASPLVVTGLTNGTAYTFTVRATNVNGQGPASAASNSVTPATVPGAPTIGTATAGNAQASVTFTAPASNGGSPIASYTVTSSPGGLTGTGATSPIVVPSLTNGTAYTFTVTATNAVGTGAASAASNSVTPSGPPGAPTIGTATAGNAQASVTFTAPASNGGSAITGYTTTSSPGGFAASGAASPLVVTGLTNGTAYTFTVRATNVNGQGPASAASNSVTPATVPGAPTIGTATAGNAQASVTFTAPASNGGSAITSYNVTSSPGGLTGTGGTSPIVVPSLTNGTAYTFTVTATNAVGTGPASAASNSVTPATVPAAPTIGTATAGDAQATVTFTAPASNGGSPITSYTVTSSPGGLTGTGAASPIVVPSLTNGTAYTFTVTATNAVGTGAASAASNSVTPATVPGAPAIGTATAGNAQASVTFTAPASNGGSPITSYTVTSSPGGLTGTGAASPIVVPSLTNGTAYTFTVTATNAVGTGAASAASNSVTPATVPGAPTIGTATAGDAQATVTFTAPASDGGSAITSYTVTSSPGSLTGTGATSPIVVPSLTNGTAYTFTVTATNAVGTGPASAASNSVTPIAAVTFADVALSVTVDDPTPGLGSNVTFTIVATNLGPSMASGVQVTDLLPPGLTYVSDTPSVGTYSLATGVWNIGTIANAGSATLSLVATVSRPQALVNHATTTAQAGVDPDASNNATLIGLNGPPLADIQVQQTVDDATPGIGATVTFTLSARNAGPSSATGIELTDLLPPSLAFVTASASQGSYVAATGLWSVGAVANGATATLQITATNTSAAPVSNVAVKTAAVESDYAAGNDAASVTLNDTTPADLSLSSTASQEPVAAGTTFAYTIVVANYGPASATGVTVTDTLPAGVALVSATPSQGSCIGTTSVSCSLGTMSVGGTAEIALVVTKTTGGPVSNVATVTANEADPNNANNSHGEVTTPVELLDFQIE